MPIPAAEDIAEDVEQIVNRTRNYNFSSSSDCCNYRYQILDTFCATQTPVCYAIMYTHLFNFIYFYLATLKISLCACNIG